MRYYLITILILLALTSAPAHKALAATTNIERLVFTTEPQSISPDTVSTSIIVQAQNAGGTAESVDETNDVIFTSSSPTGAFLNSSGNPVTTTMNKNTSSRTFFYKDSMVGAHTLSVSVKGRTSGATFSAGQLITIGTGSGETPNSSEQATSTSGTSTVTTTSSTTESDSVDTVSTTHVSSHSGSEEVSNFVSIKLGVDAGRDRIISINTPIHFLAKVEDSPSGVYSSVLSSWSFGDGTLSTGREVDHIYKFPGEYNVVLNITVGNTHATDRVRVKVIEPSLTITKVVRGPGGYVEIKNDSSDEINLQAFKVSSGDENFFFAPDTILSPHSETKFPFAFFSNKSDQVSLAYPEGETLVTMGGVMQPTVAVDPDYQIRRTEAERRLRASLSLPVSPKPQAPILSMPGDIVTQNLDQTASLVEAFKQSKSENRRFSLFTGFFAKIFNK